MPFLDRVWPRITIIASPTEFRFVGPKTESRLRPLIRLAPDGKLIAVGETATDDREGGQLVRLFEPGAAPHGSGPWANAKAFTLFCRYNLRAALEHSVGFLRPVVRFVGRRHFRALLAGREVEILTPLLLEAGARRVEFDD